MAARAVSVLVRGSASAQYQFKGHLPRNGKVKAAAGHPWESAGLQVAITLAYTNWKHSQRLRPLRKPGLASGLCVDAAMFVRKADVN